jgi:hypothetical protein
MAVFIEIIEGENLGLQLRLAEGEVYALDSLAEGRTDVNGSLHIVGTSSGGLALASSTDPLFQLAGKNVKSVILKPGVVFQIGETFYKVMRGEEELSTIESEPVKTWREIIENEIEGLAFPIQEGRVQPFNPLFRMRFVMGPQTGEEVSLGYGPREVGRDSLDIQLLDPNTPGIAFEIVPTGQGPLLMNSGGAAVKINGTSPKNSILKVGDQISIGQNLLVVES